MFESTANRQPKSHCLGWRPYNSTTKSFDQYQWIDYETVQKRRAAFGAGLVELHHKHECHRSGQYGVGLWSQNRPEWQITGEFGLEGGEFKIKMLNQTFVQIWLAFPNLFTPFQSTMSCPQMLPNILSTTPS